MVAVPPDGPKGGVCHLFPQKGPHLVRDLGAMEILPGQVKGLWLPGEEFVAPLLQPLPQKFGLEVRVHALGGTTELPDVCRGEAEVAIYAENGVHDERGAMEDQLVFPAEVVEGGEEAGLGALWESEQDGGDWGNVGDIEILSVPVPADADVRLVFTSPQIGSGRAVEDGWVGLVKDAVIRAGWLARNKGGGRGGGRGGGGGGGGSRKYWAGEKLTNDWPEDWAGAENGMIGWATEGPERDWAGKDWAEKDWAGKD